MAESIEQVSASVDALMQEFYVITHNLANVSTVGYKRRCNAFSRALEAQGLPTQTYAPGTVDLNSVFDFSQGSVVETGRPLDFALYGKGFFVVETPQGPLYTRNGMFQTNHNSQIVTSDGRIVAGQAGPITLPAGAPLSQVTVSPDGSISAGGIPVGKFSLVDFKDNQNKLVSVGAGCFQMPDENVLPVPAESLVLKQGYQEASNVKIVDELVSMIMVSRLYEANMKIVTAQKEASSSIMGVAMG
ncbi:MAG TPA: flagellar hook basal-body protein [Sedimentisphaerales bacterium]|nr:flagellar hook basal-body protein [Sedimentisphaerales bacterium]